MTAEPLRFGTAGLRGPVRDGIDAMNVPTVERASWAVAQVLGTPGATVVVGRDARHGSEEFARAAAEVFAAQGLSVLTLPEPLPTPVLAFATRQLGAAFGVQVTASHNPAGDNGYKVYGPGGTQIISPTDREIEAAMRAAPNPVPRQPVPAVQTDLVERYLRQAAAVRRGTAGARVRVALTALHGVGGRPALAALRRAGFDDVHTVTAQFDPDPDFPTVAFPNPEEPGASDALLALAEEIGADVAVALDPDADRCAVGIRDTGRWRMLSGDETGWLLGDYLLSQLPEGTADDTVVATTVVSSRMLSAIAAHHGARYVETLTGFKWLARAADALPGTRLVYAYEEAIGHCVDPDTVRDKDGISAAVLVCDLVAGLDAAAGSIPQALDELAARHGVHAGTAVSRRLTDPAAAAEFMARLREAPPRTLAGSPARVDDLQRGRDGMPPTDALVFTAESPDDATSARVVVRPSGTEPKLKYYLEVRHPVGPEADVGEVRAAARRACDRLAEEMRRW